MSNDRPIVIWDSFGIYPAFSGIARHAQELGKALRKAGTFPVLLNPTDFFNSITKPILVRPGRSYSRIFRQKSFHVYGLAKDELWLAQDLLRFRASSSTIFHGLSNFNVPSTRNRTFIKKVLTVHDLIPLLARGKVSRSLSLQMSYLLPKALDAADCIIAVSNWTANTLKEFFPKIDDRVVVIPNGFVNSHNNSVRKIKNNVSRETMPTRYLTISRFEPYKRFDRLVDILNKCSDDSFFTVVTDQKGRRFLESHALSFIKAGQLTIKCEITDLQLSKLYEESDALLHPSEYEGFCLPAAEAICRGLPVIFQKGSAIDEVVGPCGIGIDAGSSTASWLEVLKSGAWKIDQQLLSSWPKQQADWSRVAVLTREVYNEV